MTGRALPLGDVVDYVDSREKSHVDEGRGRGRLVVRDRSLDVVARYQMLPRRVRCLTPVEISSGSFLL